jgi:hypothetical protein
MEMSVCHNRLRQYQACGEAAVRCRFFLPPIYSDTYVRLILVSTRLYLFIALRNVQVFSVMDADGPVCHIALPVRNKPSINDMLCTPAPFRSTWSQFIGSSSIPG